MAAVPSPAGAPARWSAARLTVGAADIPLRNPAKHVDVVGELSEAIRQTSRGGPAPGRTPPHRLGALAGRRAAPIACWRSPIFTRPTPPELMALCIREAGKTRADAVAELREAVDFCRYYAAEARRAWPIGEPRGVFVCISPWNFPLAIFTGQIAAALVAGNTRHRQAGRADAADRRARRRTDARGRRAGRGAAPAAGRRRPRRRRAGRAIRASPASCFTGSTETARRIDAVDGRASAPDAPLIAETGGLNAMIVDSTALPEQAVRDILASAFQSCRPALLGPAPALPAGGCGAGNPADAGRGHGRACRRRSMGSGHRYRPGDRRGARSAIEAHCRALAADGRCLSGCRWISRTTSAPSSRPRLYRLDSRRAADRGRSSARCCTS